MDGALITSVRARYEPAPLRRLWLSVERETRVERFARWALRWEHVADGLLESLASMAPPAGTASAADPVPAVHGRSERHVRAAVDPRRPGARSRPSFFDESATTPPAAGGQEARFPSTSDTTEIDVAPVRYEDASVGRRQAAEPDARSPRRGAAPPHTSPPHTSPGAASRSTGPFAAGLSRRGVASEPMNHGVDPSHRGFGARQGEGFTKSGAGSPQRHDFALDAGRLECILREHERRKEAREEWERSGF